MLARSASFKSDIKSLYICSAWGGVSGSECDSDLTDESTTVGGGVGDLESGW